MALSNLSVDFTNREVFFDLRDNDSVSSLGSTSSFDEDDSDDESLSSHKMRDDRERAACSFYQRKQRSSRKNLRNMSSSKLHRRHLTSPDLKIDQFNSKSNEPGAANSRWISETTTSFTNLTVTPPGSKTNMRKSRSLEDKGVNANDRWTSKTCKKSRPKITNEVLDISGNTRASADSSKDSSGSNRWSATLPPTNPLFRSATVDHAPRTPRSSLSDLKNIRRCAAEEPPASHNARWGAIPSAPPRASYPSILPSPPRHPPAQSRRRTSRDSAPDLLRCRSHKVVSPDDGGHEKNATWASGGPRSPLSSSTDLSQTSSTRRPPLPVRGALSRWNSSSSFTVNSMSAASIDQLSTKPKLPKRRPRRRSTKKSRTPSVEQLGTPQGQVTERTRENERSEKTAQDNEQVRETRPEEPVFVEGATLTAGTGTQEATELQERTNEEETKMDASVEGAPKVGGVLLQDDTSGMEDDSSNKFHLRYSMPPCMECFETIPEEANEDEVKPPPLTNLQHQCSDSLLRAPKRRKSASSAACLEDESELSISLKDTSSLSVSVSKETSSSSFLWDLSLSSKRTTDHDTSLLGPRQPRRRDSEGSVPLGADSVCSGSSSEAGPPHHFPHRRTTAPRPHGTVRRGPSPRSAPRPIRRLSSIVNGDEKHPFSDMSGSTALTTASTASGSALSQATIAKPPNPLNNELFPRLQEPSCACGTLAKNPDSPVNCPAA